MHLAYCTNIHRGEAVTTWRRYEAAGLAVRDRVSPPSLTPSACASGTRLPRELSDPATLKDFRAWLDRENCYIFADQRPSLRSSCTAGESRSSYLPDWTTRTGGIHNRLFDLLAELLPDGVEGSVSTVPCPTRSSSKPTPRSGRCGTILAGSDLIARLSERTGETLHLGLEPEPLCSRKPARRRPGSSEMPTTRTDFPAWTGAWALTTTPAIWRLRPSAGSAGERKRFQENGVKISKLHFSSALKVRPEPKVFAALKPFVDTVVPQVLARLAGGGIVPYKDLDVALNAPPEANARARKSGGFFVSCSAPQPARPTCSEHTADRIGGDGCPGRPSRPLPSHRNGNLHMGSHAPEMKNRNVDQLVSGV